MSTQTIQQATSLIKNLKEAVNTKNYILINIWSKRCIVSTSSNTLESYIETNKLSDMDSMQVAQHIMNTCDNMLSIRVGIQLKQMRDDLDSGKTSLTEVYTFIKGLRVAENNNNLTDLKTSSKRAWKVANKELMSLAIARSLNLVVKEKQKKIPENLTGYYMGAAKKGFKTETGAKSARTRLLKKLGIPKGTVEYKIVKIGTVYAIMLPTTTKEVTPVETVVVKKKETNVIKGVILNDKAYDTQAEAEAAFIEYDAQTAPAIVDARYVKWNGRILAVLKVVSDKDCVLPAKFYNTNHKTIINIQ